MHFLPLAFPVILMGSMLSEPPEGGSLEPIAVHSIEAINIAYLKC